MEIKDSVISQGYANKVHGTEFVDGQYTGIGKSITLGLTGGFISSEQKFSDINYYVR